MVLFFAESNFSYVWNTTGQTVAGIAGNSGTASNKLYSPFSLAVDTSNTLFIADRYNNRIQKWFSNASNGTTLAGQFNGISGSGLNYLNQPGSVVIDSSGNMFIADIYNYRVLFWAQNGSSGTLVAGTGALGSSNNQLNLPQDIAYDSNTGILYVSDYDNHRVMQYLPGASSGSIVAGGNGPGYSNTQLYHPIGLYFDSSSNSLFIANFGAHNIVRWIVGNSNWTLVAGIGGSPGITSMLLYYPADVTLDSMGNIYVADTTNHRIQFFLAGQSNGTTIAGITYSAGSSSLQLNTPYGLTVDAQFNVYVADYGNHRIQKFSRL
ncbi:hypothetical protein I4U23_011077 [Adineta vaga]|nr:hypothetical protein I4U23_011077 [Adineta vaga]